ncbi:site-specific integrase (plasmid) [Streptosporangium sp. CA-135522]|uniref:site-specific integrase n=1 Tax=Streptosporangium sp. CA-135522 TaxID=3240072 RepID=UPI003D8D0676
MTGIGARAGVPRLCTHTFRHLRLTDLARAEWTIDQIAQYVGHQDVSTTLRYIHRSGVGGQAAPGQRGDPGRPGASACHPAGGAMNPDDLAHPAQEPLAVAELCRRVRGQDARSPLSNAQRSRMWTRWPRSI